MVLILLKINVYEENEKEKPKFSFRDLFKTNLEVNPPSNIIYLYYNIEENSIYYKDKDKDIKTKKDFCRSLDMLVEILSRLTAFNVKWEIESDGIDDFIRNLIDGREDFPINNILVGSQGYDLTLLGRNLRKVRGNSDIVKYILPIVDDGTYKEMLGRI